MTEMSIKKISSYNKTHKVTSLPTDLLTYLLNYILTYLIIYLLNYMLAYLLSFLLTYLPACLLTYKLTYLLTYFLNFVPSPNTHICTTCNPKNCVYTHTYAQTHKHIMAKHTKINWCPKVKF